VSVVCATVNRVVSEAQRRGKQERVSENSAYLPKSREVTHERLDGEVIAVHLESGSYFSMRGSAADLWWLMCHGLPSNLWTQHLIAVFPPNTVVQAHYEPFIQACLDAGLVTPTVGIDHLAEPLPYDYRRETWSEPILEEFTDLVDLILVDPVHDTNDEGWPYRDPSAHVGENERGT
jgi:hypothetical protein